MTALIAALRSGYTPANNAHVAGILYGECSCKIAAGSKIDSSVGCHTDGVFRIKSRCIVLESAPLNLGLELGLPAAHGRFGGEEQQIVGNITVKLYAQVLRLEKGKLHCAVVQRAGNHSPIVGAHTHRLVPTVTAHHLHLHIACEIKLCVTDFTTLMLAVTHWSIDLCHIGVYPFPLLVAP